MIPIVTAIVAGYFLTGCAFPRLREIAPPRDTANKSALQGNHTASRSVYSEQNEGKLNRPISLRRFSVNTIYGGKTGFPRDLGDNGHFRAKMTLWGASLKIVAEIYFYDTPEQVPVNPQPGQHPDGYYVLNFPMAALGPIQQQLRHSTVNLGLEWENGCWRIESIPDEQVGPPAGK